MGYRYYCWMCSLWYFIKGDVELLWKIIFWCLGPPSKCSLKRSADLSTLYRNHEWEQMKNIIHRKSQWKETLLLGEWALKPQGTTNAWLNWLQKRVTKTTVMSLIKWGPRYVFSAIAIRGERGKKTPYSKLFLCSFFNLIPNATNFDWPLLSIVLWIDSLSREALLLFYYFWITDFIFLIIFIHNHCF